MNHQKEKYLSYFIKIEYLILLILTVYFLAHFVLEKYYHNKAAVKYINSLVFSNKEKYGIENILLLYDNTKNTTVKTYDLLPNIYWVTKAKPGKNDKFVLLAQLFDSAHYSNVPFEYKIFKDYFAFQPISRLNPRKHIIGIERPKNDSVNVMIELRNFNVVLCQPLKQYKPDVSNLWEVKNADVQSSNDGTYFGSSLKKNFAQIRTIGYAFGSKVKINVEFTFTTRKDAIQIFFGEAHSVFFERRNRECKIGIIQAYNKNGIRLDRRYDLFASSNSDQDNFNLEITRDNNRFIVFNNETKDTLFIRNIELTNITNERYHSVGYLVWAPSKILLKKFEIFEF